ncbi:unnamed protein product [Gongylonema pulchrum]|uniref:CO_deh_flav_C domain-containing protein n=1 Tax=Gongylonema pulchrum TaxID=637853 RepID=A0A183E4U1_9BILA|nr:unnamed protein product [Gongylonema pulchrum]
MLDKFQTIAGNIVTATPLSDLNPIWMASGASVLVNSETRGERCVSIDDKFFISYRKTVICPDEVICGIWIPFTKKDEQFMAYKQSQRREDDITIVSGAFAARIDAVNRKISDIRMAFSGVAPLTKMATQTQQKLSGRIWNKELLHDARVELREEFQLAAGVPGGMERYRQALVLSLFTKFFIHISQKLQPSMKNEGILTCTGDAGEELRATQIHQAVPYAQAVADPVGRPVMHQSGVKHTTGEAAYCDDYCPKGLLFSIPWKTGCLHADPQSSLKIGAH